VREPGSPGRSLLKVAVLGMAQVTQFSEPSGFPALALKYDWLQFGGTPSAECQQCLRANSSH